MISTTSPMHIYQKKIWGKFSDFTSYLYNIAEKVQPKMFFEGEGFLEVVYDGIKEKHHLILINKKLYSSLIIEKENSQFAGIVELDLSLLSTNLFPKYEPVNYFIYLEPNLDVDCKPYDYGTEHKLLISKANKVDLLFSHQLFIVDNKATIKAHSYPSLKQAVDWQKKLNGINARTAKTLEDMKNSKNK